MNRSDGKIVVNEADLADIRELVNGLSDEISKEIVSYGDIIEDLLICLVAGGHLLLEGVPGIAKTTLAKTFTTATSLEYSRVQFTQDMLPSDVTGHYYFDQNEGTFKVRKGPIFTEILLADEINRAPPKTQSALLESMEERQVTIEGNTFELPSNFMVIATLNPIEAEGVYPLPEAQLDRFMFKSKMGYLNRRDELRMLKRKVRYESRPSTTAPVGSRLITKMKKAFPGIRVDDRILRYIRDIVIASRSHESIVLGASPRAGEQMVYAAQARALIHGRAFVLPDDVKKVAVRVLVHRLLLSVEAEMESRSTEALIDELLSGVRVPKS